MVHCDKPDEAIITNRKAHHLITQLNDQLGLAEFHKIQGIIECKLLSHTKAEIHFKRAYSLYEELENLLGMAEVSEEIGDVLSETGKINKAMQYYSEAINHYNTLNLPERATIVSAKLETIPAPIGEDTNGKTGQH